MSVQPIQSNGTIHNSRIALITGITGQDGSYLAELLISKGYIVHGLIRRSSSFNTGRLEHIYSDSSLIGKFYLHYGDLTDSTNLVNIIGKIQPDEVYNLAAQSHVAVSFEMPQYTGDVDGIGTLRLLDAIRTCGLEKHTKFYQASTSELYGGVQGTAQSELTPFYPRSPYGVAKLYSYNIVVNYREAYGMYAVNGILFNHESPRRGPTFVTRKTTRAVARIKAGLQDCLYLGNLDASRDWGHAKDYVEGMWRIMNKQKIQSINEIDSSKKYWPSDYVLSSDETYKVRYFVECAFKSAGITIQWNGTGVDECGINTANQQVVVRIDPKYYRPSEVDLLWGISTKARTELQWSPTYTFESLVDEMVIEDIRSIEQGKTLCFSCGTFIQTPAAYKTVPSDAESIHAAHGDNEQCAVCATSVKLAKYKFDENKKEGGNNVWFDTSEHHSEYATYSKVPRILSPGQRNKQVALITGVTGQDGSYLAQRLLAMNYEVHGVVRRSSSFNTGRIQRIYSDTHVKDPNFYLHYGDLTDSANLTHLVGTVRPDELYNLAAQSHVKVSFEMSEYTADIDALGTLRLLDAIRVTGLSKHTKFYQASTSELYGGIYNYATDEDVPFYPRSPYAVAKQYAFWIVKNYREAYGMYAVNGILFNHESPRRGETFVTRKVTRAVAHIKAGLQDVLELGNIDASRDWGHADDYVEGMWRILNKQSVHNTSDITPDNLPKDYVLSSNETHTVREFVEKAFAHVGIIIYWHGSGSDEYGTVGPESTSRRVVQINPLYYRPSEVEFLWGNSNRARNELGWKPSCTFDRLVETMVISDLASVGINEKNLILPSIQLTGVSLVSPAERPVKAH